MLLTKLIALVALISWLGATGERLYDCFASGDTASTYAKDEQAQAGRWAVSQLRW